MDNLNPRLNSDHYLDIDMDVATLYMDLMASAELYSLFALLAPLHQAQQRPKED